MWLWEICARIPSHKVMATECILIQEENSPWISVAETSSRKFPVIFIGTSIGMPMYSGNKFFMKSSHLKFGCTENSWENAGSIQPK